MSQQDLAQIAAFIQQGRKITLLTGAGISTQSGIPDYRDENGEWKHARPVMFADFMSDATVRQRYWARTTVGWPRMAQAQPGKAHEAIHALEKADCVERIVTQNVDGLHQKAGSTNVIDLHGRLDEVRCQQCHKLTPRADWQTKVKQQNDQWLSDIGAVTDAPDGDAIIEHANYAEFLVPDCDQCGGIVKPEVVFFGENVPKQYVADAYAAVAAADGLLVAGSSLMVFSGFRFARRCAELNKPCFIINRGVTRADELATLKIEMDCGEALAEIAYAVGETTN
ncbi:MAG: NAD-dependent protein deacetylase [Woeseiaceae bacterium]